MAPIPNATVLAFDFGTHRIGVAVGNTLVRIAQPLVTIAAEPATTMAMIGALVAEWQPARLIVGLPLHADGTPHRVTEKATRFASDLHARFALPVSLVDERWTTQTAQDRLNAERRGRVGRNERDALAAQQILQAYFDERGDSADS